MGKYRDLNSSRRNKRPIPRFAYNARDAAEAFGVTKATFLSWVSQRLMPQPIKIRNLELYDAYALQDAWDKILSSKEKEPENLFEKYADWPES